MDFLSGITDWLKKNVVQPVTSTVSSWLTPSTTKATTTPLAPFTAPAASQISAATNWVPVTTTPTKTTAVTTTPQSIIDKIKGWFSPQQPAQLGPKSQNFIEWALQNPMSTLTQSWAQTLPSNAANDVIRRQLQINALQQQLAGYKTQEQVYKSLYPTFALKASGEPTGYLPTGLPYQTLEQAQSWLSGKYPTMFSPTGEDITPRAAGTPEYWTKSAKGIVGSSEQGKSLLGSIQDWLGSAALGSFSTPFTPKPVGAAPPAGAQPSTAGIDWSSMKGRAPLEGWQNIQAPETAVPPPGSYTGLQGEKNWWEGGTRGGIPTPEQLNTPEYVQGYLEALLGSEAHPEYYTDEGKPTNLGKQAQADAWNSIIDDAKDGYYSIEQISKNPELHDQLATNMMLLDKYDPQWVESQQDEHLAASLNFVKSVDKTKLPDEISQARLDAMARGADFGILYDTGYQSDAYKNEFTTGIQQLQSQGVPVNFDPTVLSSLTYANIEAVKQQLAQMTPQEWQKLIENEGTLVFKTEPLIWNGEIQYNAKGEQINSGQFVTVYPPNSKVTTSEKEQYIEWQRFLNEWYWSDEAIAQRQKEREESYEYYHEKELEGWGEYYAALDDMKLYADANEYWSQPGKFAELRRKWETSGSNLSWGDWLKQYDFEGEWYAQSPTERGEKKYVYSPRMIRINY